MCCAVIPQNALTAIVEGNKTVDEGEAKADDGGGVLHAMSGSFRQGLAAVWNAIAAREVRRGPSTHVRGKPVLAESDKRTVRTAKTKATAQVGIPLPVPVPPGTKFNFNTELPVAASVPSPTLTTVTSESAVEVLFAFVLYCCECCEAAGASIFIC